MYKSQLLFFNKEIMINNLIKYIPINTCKIIIYVIIYKKNNKTYVEQKIELLNIIYLNKEQLKTKYEKNYRALIEKYNKFKIKHYSITIIWLNQSIDLNQILRTEKQIKETLLKNKKNNTIKLLIQKFKK